MNVFSYFRVTYVGGIPAQPPALGGAGAAVAVVTRAAAHTCCQTSSGRRGSRHQVFHALAVGVDVNAQLV